MSDENSRYNGPRPGPKLRFLKPLTYITLGVGIGVASQGQLGNRTGEIFNAAGQAADTVKGMMDDLGNWNELIRNQSAFRRNMEGYCKAYNLRGETGVQIPDDGSTVELDEATSEAICRDGELNFSETDPIYDTIRAQRKAEQEAAENSPTIRRR